MGTRVSYPEEGKRKIKRIDTILRLRLFVTVYLTRVRPNLDGDETDPTY
ncbi:hypothetical protein JNUCC42_03835 [Brevibacterium sp. JNUCC-42]|nr:hypothetical protein JNUCC42_03835 [Brevibacterium sp. JNUCC-42]